MRALLAVVIAAFVLLAGSVVTDHAAGAPEPPTFEPADCVSMAQGTDTVDASRLTCGFVEVQQTRGDSDSRALRLAVLVLKARNTPAQPDPIVFLSGGPGQSSVDSALFSWGHTSISGVMQDDRDIVFFDQRGTGLSGALACPEFDRVAVDELSEGLTDDEGAQRSDDALVMCRDRYLADGVDLDAYDSAQSALDIVDVLTALGYEEWNLYGVSYGTTLALVALRDTEGTRSVVLDSTSPPQVNSGIERARTFEATLQELFDACAESPECSTAYPGFENVFWDLIDRANADPIEVQIEDTDGSPLPVAIDGSAIIDGTFSAMYDPNLVALVPLAIHDIAAGNTGILTLLAQELIFQDFGISTGMFHSVLCNEEIPFYTESQRQAENEGVRLSLVEAGLDASSAEGLVEQQHQCDLLNAPHPPSIANRAVESDVPALILAGRFDPVTPTEYGRLAADGLSNSYYLEFPTMAHAVDFYVPECAGPIAASFLANPDVAPDASCIAALPEIAWVLPEAEPTAEPFAPTPTAPSGVITAPDTGTGETARARSDATWFAGAAMIVAGVMVASTARKLRR